MPDIGTKSVAFPRFRGFLIGGFLTLFLGAMLGPHLPHAITETSDYTEYASAARLLRAGENPYDWAKLLPIQETHGWTEPQADMMWNPPWVFPVVLPLAWLPWEIGQGFWAAGQLVAVIAACGMTWTLYGGPDRTRGIVLPLTLTFAPMLTMLRLGQIPGFILLGLVGFLVAMRANRPGLAGVAAALTAIKPHLLLPFGVLLLCDSALSPHSRRAVIVGAGVLLLATAFPMFWNPDVWQQWRTAIDAPSDDLHHAPSAWVLPTIGYQLRVAVNGELWIQFLPSVIGTVGLVAYWWQRRRAWNWERELPIVTLISVLTTGYGAMGFDQVVLLLPVVSAAVVIANHGSERLRMWSLMAYLLVNGAAISLLLPVLWWAPAVAVGYFVIVLGGTTRP